MGGLFVLKIKVRMITYLPLNKFGASLRLYSL